MGKYTGPVCRMCRAQGQKLFLKGERCFTPHCAIERRKAPPGPHAQTSRRRRPTEFGQHLHEKQKARWIYGLMERQFSRFFGIASKSPGNTGAMLIQLLERRLDNAVYKLGYGESRNKARQIVTHGHITVNGRKASIPSLVLKAGDKIAWAETSKKTELYKVFAASNKRTNVPAWLRPGAEGAAEVVALPGPADVDTTVDTRLIVEYYSKR